MYGGLAAIESTMLPGSRSLNTPNPVRNTVFGANCHEIAVRGCHRISGVEANSLSRPVTIAWLRGCSRLWGEPTKEPGKLAIRLCGLIGLVFVAVRTPNVQVTFAESFRVSWANKSTFR